MTKIEVSRAIKMKRTFKLVFVMLLVDLVAFTLILPLLPKILEYYAKNDSSGSYKLYDDNIKKIQNILMVPESHNQVLLAGMLGSWFSFLQFVSSPIVGAISDRYGRKNVMMLTMSGSIVSYLIWFMSRSNFSAFILSRTIGGLSKASVGLSLAAISDVSDESSRGRGMAIVGSSFSIAFIIGPLLGAFLSTFAKDQDDMYLQLISYPSMIAILLSIIGLAIVMLLFEETNRNKTNSIKTKKNSINGNNLSQQLPHNYDTLSKAFHHINPRSIFRFSFISQIKSEHKNRLVKTGMTYFYYLLFYSGLEFTLSFLTHIRFRFTSMDQGKLYLFSGLLMAAIQGGYIRRVKGGKESLMALIGLTTIIPAFIIMGLSSKVSHIYFSLTIYAISSAIVVPCLTTVASNNCPPEHRGAVMGTFRSIGALARAIGPFLASFLFWTLGSTTCYMVCALALIIPHQIMKRLYSEMKEDKQCIEKETKRKILGDNVQIAKAS